MTTSILRLKTLLPTVRRNGGGVQGRQEGVVGSLAQPEIQSMDSEVQIDAPNKIPGTRLMILDREVVVEADVVAGVVQGEDGEGEEGAEQSGLVKVDESLHVASHSILITTSLAIVEVEPGVSRPCATR